MIVSFQEIFNRIKDTLLFRKSFTILSRIQEIIQSLLVWLLIIFILYLVL